MNLNSISTSKEKYQEIARDPQVSLELSELRDSPKIRKAVQEMIDNQLSLKMQQSKPNMQGVDYLARMQNAKQGGVDAIVGKGYDEETASKYFDALVLIKKSNAVKLEYELQKVEARDGAAQRQFLERLLTVPNIRRATTQMESDWQNFMDWEEPSMLANYNQTKAELQQMIEEHIGAFNQKSENSITFSKMTELPYIAGVARQAEAHQKSKGGIAGS